MHPRYQTGLDRCLLAYQLLVTLLQSLELALLEHHLVLQSADFLLQDVVLLAEFATSATPYSICASSSAVFFLTVDSSLVASECVSLRVRFTIFRSAWAFSSSRLY